MNSLIEHLKKVKDIRRKQGQKHPLWGTLLIVILGLMAGYIGYRALAHFAKTQHYQLNKYFGICHQSVPSHSTIRRAMIQVDWADLIQVFNQWAGQLFGADDETKWLAIDGKSLKSTVVNHFQKQQNFVEVISVFCPGNGLVLHLAKIERKHQSELQQIQDIARDSGLTNKVFTLDALHCQKQTVNLITAGFNDYLIAVKKNQIKLYNCLEAEANNAQLLSQDITEDLSHGRQITRQVSVFLIPEKLKSLWSNSQRFIQVQRRGKRQGKSYQETAYYLSSREEKAEIFGQKIREHWRIENQLHWVKDVIFLEDKSRSRQFQPATNFSILSTIAMNLFRILGFLSVTEGRRWLCERFWQLAILLA